MQEEEQMTKEKLFLDSRFGEDLHVSKSKHTSPLSDAFNPCRKKKPETMEEKFAEKGLILLK